MTTVLMSEITLDLVNDAIGPIEKWAKQCHGASLALVKSGLLPEGSRVARGHLPGIVSQHSWATGPDPYARYAAVVDVTRWSYEDKDPYVWLGTVEHGRYHPHGAGSIFDYGKPVSSGGEPIELTPSEPLSRDAKDFLTMLGRPLDLRGWMALANAPVGDWPASEIIAAMDDTPELRAMVPIDILGMITDRNPNGLYLPTEEGS